MDKLDRIWSILKRLRKQKRGVYKGAGDAYPPSVQYLEDRINNLTGDDKMVVADLLASEYSRYQMYDQAIEIRLQLIKQNPENEQEWHSYSIDLKMSGQYKEARIAIEKAVELARKNRSWLRLMLGYKARMERDDKDYEAMENTLRQLILAKDFEPVQDYAYEIDILFMVPEGKLDPRVIAEYLNLFPEEKRAEYEAYMRRSSS